MGLRLLPAVPYAARGCMVCMWMRACDKTTVYPKGRSAWCAPGQAHHLHCRPPSNDKHNDNDDDDE